jgi:hypothetical protein
MADLLMSNLLNGPSQGTSAQKLIGMTGTKLKHDPAIDPPVLKKKKKAIDPPIQYAICLFRSEPPR